MLDDGTYELRFPIQYTVAGIKYGFQSWNDSLPPVIDNVTQQVVRTINLNSAFTIGVLFTEVNTMANVTFTGKATPVTAGPRSVTVIVTLPDGVTKDTLPAVTTDASGNYTTSKQYLAGSYSAIANAVADSLNKAGSSPSKPFTVGLADTTVTLDVAVTPP